MSSARRPILVVLILCFYFISTSFTILSWVLVYTGKIPLNQATQAYMHSLTLVDYATTLILVLLNLAANIYLFLLRREAAYLFLMAWILNAGITSWHALSKGWLNALSTIGSGGGLVGAFLGMLLITGVTLYVWWLKKKGVLQ